MDSINERSILAKILRAPKTRAVARARLEARVAAAKQALLEEFDSSPVTQELLEGPEAKTRLMPGGEGNLFSFLGFNEKDVPTAKVRQVLERIALLSRVTIQGEAWVFTVSVPTKEDLDDASPMNWEAGRSWVDAVTYGIGTFSHYMFSLTNNRFTNSKSSTAIQVQPNLRHTASYFSGVGYVIGMLGRFRRRLER